MSRWKQGRRRHTKKHGRLSATRRGRRSARAGDAAAAGDELKQEGATRVAIPGTEVREADWRTERIGVCSPVIPSSLALPSFLVKHGEAASHLRSSLPRSPGPCHTCHLSLPPRTAPTHSPEGPLPAGCSEGPCCPPLSSQKLSLLPSLNCKGSVHLRKMESSVWPQPFVQGAHIP